MNGRVNGEVDRLKVFCGIDWAELHHDIALVDQDGQLIAKRRIKDSAEGFAELLTMLAEAGDTGQAPIPVAIETPRGLLVADLAAAAKLSRPRLAAALKKAGRRRFIDPRATELQAGFREPRLRQPALVEQAMGRQALALLATLDVECRNVDDLSQSTAEAFQQHPDHAIVTSFPGLNDNTGARILAEIGDDRTRFTDARALKAYAGSAPITRASGRSLSVSFRRIKNDRLVAAGWIWAFAAMANHQPAAAHYHRRRDHGDRHTPALRNLFNRQLGQLWYCLQTGQHYDQNRAFLTSNRLPPTLAQPDRSVIARGIVLAERELNQTPITVDR